MDSFVLCQAIYSIEQNQAIPEDRYHVELAVLRIIQICRRRLHRRQAHLAQRALTMPHKHQPIMA